MVERTHKQLDDFNTGISMRRIQDFFRKLILEKFPADKSKENRLVLITRKGYWLFKTILKSEDMLDLVNDNKVIFFSDRKALKDLKFELIENKNIYVFDDTVSNGNNMFFYYCLFKKHKAKEVYPIVLAVSTEFFNNRSKEPKFLEYRRVYRSSTMFVGEMKQKCEKLFEEFRDNLKYEVLFAPDDIARFSIQESLWFQKNIEPMVMDLPVFYYVDADGKKEITLSEEQFAKIRLSTAKWEFIENIYDELGETIHCDFFQLNDDFLYNKFKSLFFNFIVKCKYQPCEGGIKIVFIPFAMIKSGDLLSVWRCFKELMDKNYPYYKKIYDYMKKEGIKSEDEEDKIIKVMKKNHNMCRGMFRAIIFSLSNYVAYLFQEKIMNDIGLKMYYDEGYMKENCDDEFTQTFIDEYLEFDKHLYLEKINACEYNNSSIYAWQDEFLLEKEDATVAKVELYIRERIVHSKYQKFDRKKKVTTIEALEIELDRRFYFKSDSQKRLYMTKALILLLELSCSGNDIVVDNDDSVIYRGFRAGENSETMMPAGLKWVYPYIFSFYFYADEAFYIDNYKIFALWMNTLFINESYVGSVIEQENLEYYMRYFGEIDREHLYEQIMNKSYLLDDFRKDQMTNQRKVFIQNAFCAVKEWGDKVYVGCVD